MLPYISISLPISPIIITIIIAAHKTSPFRKQRGLPCHYYRPALTPTNRSILTPCHQYLLNLSPSQKNSASKINQPLHIHGHPKRRFSVKRDPDAYASTLSCTPHLSRCRCHHDSVLLPNAYWFMTLLSKYHLLRTYQRTGDIPVAQLQPVR